MSGREQLRRMAVTRLLVTVAFLALVASGGASLSVGSEIALGPTCAYTGKGRLLGCLDDAFDCQNLFDSRRGGRWFMTEWYAPKDPPPPPEAAAERIGPGTWRVLAWPSRRILGVAVATNAARTRWRITDRGGDFAARARGPGGPQMGMVILHWGKDAFC